MPEIEMPKIDVPPIDANYLDLVLAGEPLAIAILIAVLITVYFVVKVSTMILKWALIAVVAALVVLMFFPDLLVL